MNALQFLSRFVETILQVLLTVDVLRAIPIFILEYYSMMILVAFAAMPLWLGITAILPRPNSLKIIASVVNYSIVFAVYLWSFCSVDLLCYNFH
jgi:hypothetical protein